MYLYVHLRMHANTNVETYICIPLYVIIGGWGGESNREIVSFRSCVRASGRGEAKLRGRARDDVLCVARAPADPVTPSGRSRRLRAGLSRGLSRRLSRRLSRARPADASVPGCPAGCPVRPRGRLRAGLSRGLSRRLSGPLRAGVVPLVVPWDASCQFRAG